MEKTAKKSFTKTAKKWIIRFVKFNIVGLLVFLVGTVIFMSAFSAFGAWSWLIANGAGGVLQFSIITFLNKTKRGKIFDISEKKNQLECKNENLP
jgi:putative flippase GtrA